MFSGVRTYKCSVKGSVSRPKFSYIVDLIRTPPYQMYFKIAFGFGS